MTAQDYISQETRGFQDALQSRLQHAVSDRDIIGGFLFRSNPPPPKNIAGMARIRSESGKFDVERISPPFLFSTVLWGPFIETYNSPVALISGETKNFLRVSRLALRFRRTEKALGKQFSHAERGENNNGGGRGGIQKNQNFPTTKKCRGKQNFLDKKKKSTKNIGN